MCMCVLTLLWPRVCVVLAVWGGVCSIQIAEMEAVLHSRNSETKELKVRCNR